MLRVAPSRTLDWRGLTKLCGPPAKAAADDHGGALLVPKAAAVAKCPPKCGEEKALLVAKAPGLTRRGLRAKARPLARPPPPPLPICQARSKLLGRVAWKSGEQKAKVCERARAVTSVIERADALARCKRTRGWSDDSSSSESYESSDNSSSDSYDSDSSSSESYDSEPSREKRRRR